MIKFNDTIRGMGEYIAPISGRADYDGFLLDFNERTMPVDAGLLNFLDEALLSGLERYPEYPSLLEDISDYALCKSNQIMVTNGSDQAIDLVFRAFLTRGDKVLIPSPSFAMFYQFAQLNGAEIIAPKYTIDDGFPMDEVFESLSEVQLLVLCNPNNPTGTLLSLLQIEALLENANGLDLPVLVDEAYFEFSGVSSVGLIDKFPNLFVTRTFSKAFGLAALRLGYVISNKDNIEQLKKMTAPYDVNFVAASAGSYVLNNKDDMESYVREVMSESKLIVEACFDELGIRYFDSRANFICFQSSDGFYEYMKSEGFLMRPQRDSFVRVTIGSSVQMSAFVDKTKAYFLKKFN